MLPFTGYRDRRGRLGARRDRRAIEKPLAEGKTRGDEKNRGKGLERGLETIEQDWGKGGDMQPEKAPIHEESREPRGIEMEM